MASCEVPLGDKVAFLSRPDTYPDRSGEVLVKETHLSWVFLTDLHAYKLKKPLWREYVDLSTLEARHRNCEAEVRSNRRLAPDVYLGIVPLTLSERGLELGGAGQVVDWLVQMVRLPEELMLDQALASGKARPQDIGRVATILGKFYGNAQRAEVTAEQYRDRILGDISRTEHSFATAGEMTRAERVRRVAGSLRATLLDRFDIFSGRVCDGHIVEGHGDLRPEHVYIGEGPAIIDCLEFSRELRLIDPVDELGFLGLECDLLGAPWVGPLLLRIYQETSGDVTPSWLVTFYRSFRALQRSRLALWHLADPGRHPPQHWMDRADLYIAWSERAVARL